MMNTRHMLSETGTYMGATAVLSTKHGKAAAFAPALRQVNGVHVVTAFDLDTDQLGTFTGEVERPGNMLEVAIKKARLGMAASGLRLGIASEGSFGPHPSVPFVAAGQELAVWVDDDRGLVIHATSLVLDTNSASLVAGPDHDIDAFLARVGFPSHAIIVRPNDPQRSVGAHLKKGLTELQHVRRCVAEAASASQDGKALIETDMRAHLNPKRMRSITQLAEKLSARIASLCPACSTPGFGLVELRRGLPCSLCGCPTEMVAAEYFGCACCAYREHRPRADGLVCADPGKCPECNP